MRLLLCGVLLVPMLTGCRSTTRFAVRMPPVDSDSGQCVAKCEANKVILNDEEQNLLCLSGCGATVSRDARCSDDTSTERPCVDRETSRFSVGKTIALIAVIVGGGAAVLIWNRTYDARNPRP